MIRFQCPKCDASLKCSVQHAGKKLNCKSCKSPIVVPSPEPDEFDYSSTIARLTGNHGSMVDEFDQMQTFQASSASESSSEAEPSEESLPPIQDQKLSLGTLIGSRYLITGRLGQGGMGTVYRVIDTQTEVEYAMKVISSQMQKDTDSVKQLQREFAIAQQLTHPNLLRLNHFDSSSEHIFLLMEYLNGENVDEYRTRKAGQLESEEVKRFLEDIAAPLDFLHDQGVVHLDLKPHNLMYCQTTGGERQLKITDFGISKSLKEQIGRFTGAVDLQGTLCYMSPEQLKNEVCDRRSDIYSLGIILYQLLTGKFPFDLTSPKDVIAWHIGPDSELTDLSEPWRSIIEKCLRESPDERFASCKQVLNAFSPAAGTVRRLSNQPVPTDVFDHAVDSVFRDIQLTVGDKQHSVEMIWASEQEAADYITGKMELENVLSLPLMAIASTEHLSMRSPDPDEIQYTLVAWALAKYPEDMKQIRGMIESKLSTPMTMDEIPSSDDPWTLSLREIANNREELGEIAKFRFQLILQRNAQSNHDSEPSEPTSSPHTTQGLDALCSVTLEDLHLDTDIHNNTVVRVAGVYKYSHTSTRKFIIEDLNGNSDIDAFVYYEALPREQRARLLRENEMSGQIVVVEGRMEYDHCVYIHATNVVFQKEFELQQLKAAETAPPTQPIPKTLAPVGESSPITASVVDDTPPEQIIREAFQYLENAGGIFLAPNIPNKKVQGALTYARGIEPQEIIVLCDNTVFGSAKNGFFMTLSAIHWQNTAGEGRRRIRFDEVDQVQITYTQTIFAQSKVFINQVPLEVNTESVAHRNAVADAISSILQRLKESSS